MERVVGEGVRTSAKRANADVRFGGATEGGVTEHPAAVALLESGAVAETFDANSFTEEGGAAFLKAREYGAVGVKEGEDDGAVNSCGREFGAKPARLANPGDTVADGIECKLGAEVGLGGRGVVSGTDDGDTVHGDAGVALLGGEHATGEAF